MTHNAIRNHLLTNLGMVDRPQLPDLPTLRESQRSREFERLCSNRMAMGAFRYGLLEDQRRAGSPFNNVGSIFRRLLAYKRTGNLEHIIDAANLCMIEFETGNHPKRHLQAEDDGEHTERKR